MLKNKTLTYISLFSSAGIGCYGFQKEGYKCVATNEIVERRLDVQKANGKCDFDSGYIAGDISTAETKDKIYREIERWNKLGNDRVDVVIATPPCQGISVINHKKNENDLARNSLVVQSVELIKQIRPRFFIFENVMAFQKALCMTSDNGIMPIGEYVREELGCDYIITGRIMNLMNYGSNSSRTRTLMVGVDKSYRNNIAPYDLFPEYRTEKILRDVIYSYPRLEWGEIDSNDFYHAFRTYNPKMRDWIHDLKEGQSAFDNEDPMKRPHQIKNGVLRENTRKNRDKYTRQIWDRFIQCVHTRNDQLAAQNTIHPEQDRVYSIRELMEMMTIPYDFRWIPSSLDELNSLPETDKRHLYKTHEVNIRQCLGEAVPTEIMRQIAQKIKSGLFSKRCESLEINRIISEYSLDNRLYMNDFLRQNPLDLDVASLMRITELCNAKRDENAAFYTNKFIVNEIMEKLPNFPKGELRILEPSVGAGSFIPFLFKHFDNVPNVYLDVVDIDESSIETLKILIQKLDVPANFSIQIICADFLTLDMPCKYDLIVGNPPFSKMKKNYPAYTLVKNKNINQETNNLSEMFLEKCATISDYVALVLNKTILSTSEFVQTRDWLKGLKIETIIDFGRYGFTGVSIETMCLSISPKQRPGQTLVYNMKYNRKYVQDQSYITDEKFPYFLIYRDKIFDTVAEKLEFDIFDVFRDRQITKAKTYPKQTPSSIWVIKARNLNDDGSGVTHIKGYDAYIDQSVAEGLSVYQYVNNRDVYLTPNMTYNPRVIKNLTDVIPDGSVAVLIPKNNRKLTKKQMQYFATEEYRAFYSVARNLSTQSINVDKTSVFFYGVLRNDN